MFHLKPGLRSNLIREVFSNFLGEFRHIFKHENQVTGKEFVSYFVSAIYCRIYIANQTIINRGENFSELFMIQNG